ncbi:MAG TPA: 5-dehydro-2-deoxygluconokinase [Solirubrobacteraceae bacterium]|nr:5-dehydro-2-deoxygluconokinase [Solirubrobacteraceae bacterium]
MADLDLLTVGRISIDLYCDQVGADWHAARSFSKAVGGSATNVAIAAARLGHRAAVYTKVGTDPFGEVAVQELRDFGVDTRFVSVEPGTITPLAFAVLDPPEDPQLLFRREPPAPDLQLRTGEVDWESVEAVRVMWITGSALSQEPSRSTVDAMLSVRARRRHTVLDLDYRPTFWRSREEASAGIGAAVAHATIAVGNRGECGVAVGTDDPREAAARLRERGVELSIVKLGGDGVLLSNAEGDRLIEPPQIQVLCGLGAGDAFGGALCHGLLSGWSHERTVAFANAAGGIVASRLLCSHAMPYEHEVAEMMGKGRRRLTAAPWGGTPA